MVQIRGLKAAIIALVGLFAFSGMMVAIPSTVSATPDTHVWDGGGADVYAGTHANWVSDTAPVEGDSVIFNAGALPCIWNLTGTFNDFTLATGYTGTVTLGNVIGVHNLTVQAGVLAANYKVITASGNVTHTGGTTSNYYLTMTGDDTRLESHLTNGLGLLNLSITADVTLCSHNSTNGINSIRWYIGAGATVTLEPSVARTFSYRAYPGYSTYNWVNLGEIVGSNATAAYMAFDVRGTTTQTFGDIDCSILLKIPSTATSSKTLTIGDDINTSGNFEVVSEHGTYTLTVESSSQNLTADCFYLGPRTTFNADDSILTISGAFNTDEGTFTTTDSELIFTPQTSNVLERDGVWCWFADPRGVYYNGATYYGYLDRPGSVFIARYDHTTKERDMYELYDQAPYDDHGNPALWIRPDGRILVAWANHAANNLWYAISTNPEDVSSWSEEIDIAVTSELVSYPQLCYLSSESKMYLFTRNGSSQDGDWCYRTSTNMGNTWTAPTTMLDYGSASMYVKFATDTTDTIYFAATQSESNTHANVATFYYTSGSFYESDGTLITAVAGLPMAESDLEMVYNSTTEGYPAWVWDIAIEGEDVAIVYAIFEEPTSEHTYEYARFHDESWTAYELVGGGNMTAGASYHYSGGIYLDHSDIDTLYLSTKREGDWLQIEKWVTETVGASWSYASLTNDAECKNIRPFVVWNHADDLDVMWLSGAYDGWSGAQYTTNIQMESNLRIVPSNLNVSDYSNTIEANGYLNVYVDSCTLRIASGTVSDYTIVIDELASDSCSWTMTASPTLSVIYTVSGLEVDMGYKVYQNGVVITTGTGPVVTFTASGGGEFEVVTWYEARISNLIVLTINMVGLGIMASVVVGWVMPFAKDIKKGKYTSTDKMVNELIRGVIFIVVGMFMYVMLYNVAIG